MTLRIGTATQIERNPRDLSGDVPAAAYFMASGTAGLYSLGSGDKEHEATAFLKDVGSDVFSLDDSLVEEDRILFLVATSTVIV